MVSRRPNGFSTAKWFLDGQMVSRRRSGFSTAKWLLDAPAQDSIARTFSQDH
jgi:hypothetical protein